MNRLFAWVRANKLFRLVYHALNLAPLYHWSWAILGGVLYPVNKKLIVIGITGTKGKTTTLELLSAALEAGGKSTALLSSVRMKVADRSVKNMTGNSMPGRMHIHRFLRSAARAGCTHAIVEVTSEGVKYSRHLFIPWRIAALTNLAPEHIESHGSFERYRAAKGAFLAYAMRHGAAVFLNSDDPESAAFYADELRQIQPEPNIVFYSGTDVTWVRESKQETSDDPQLFFLRFNKENIAAARAIGLRLGLAEEGIKRAVEGFSGVPGRLDFVQATPFAAVVDYAHTPDSLLKVYDTLRASPYRAAEGKLIAVLGSCGGGRDKWKRPIMGEIAAEQCDEIILTNEDPYDEDPETVLREIASGFATAQNKKFTTPDSYRIILDRQEALNAAVRDARPGDIVIATGKGSESWIHMAGGKLEPWNEREAMQNAITAARGN
jgi:UDP-N-acetylmuramoyl-L-alanyl-D-glutamate--2,6-diaminopimelate ligase